jgi:hypothetical protein
MLMARVAEHLRDLGLTLSRQFICQHGKVCGNELFAPNNAFESLPVTQRSSLCFSGVSHREVA